MSKTERNFGRNVEFVPAVFAKPRSHQQLLDTLGQHHDKPVRVVASRHAWSEGIRTGGLLLCLEHLDEIRLSADRKTVSAGAGCRVKDLLQRLSAYGLTLPSVGLIDEQTVAGATATGTHGSGKHSLSHYVASVLLAHPDKHTGQATLTRVESGAALRAARCSLGALGVVVEVELQTRPAYNVSESLKRHRFVEDVLACEEQYPLQQFFFMPWSWHIFGQHRTETEKPRSFFASVYRLYWHLGIDWGLHLVLYLLVKIFRIHAIVRAFYRFVVPLTIVRNRRVIDDSHRMLTMEHELFRHIEIELFVRREQLPDALEFVKSTITFFGGREHGRKSAGGEFPPDEFKGTYLHHYPICVRRVLEDDTLISMASGGADESQKGSDWYAISLISIEWVSKRDGFLGFANWLATQMAARFEARCHWGKYNPLDRATSQRLYPHIDEFRKIADAYDPEKRFSNEWIKEVLR